MNLLRLPRPINGVLLDISGVLKDGGAVIKGSIDALNRLREAGLLIKLVTNETQETRQSLAQSLASMGFSVEEKDIIPPCPALIKLLIQEQLRPHLLVHPNVMKEFEGMDMSNPNCVVIGDAAENFTYENLNAAFKILMELEKPRLFSLGRGRYYKQDGDLLLDVGVYAAALEYATGVQAEVIGKPQPEFFKSALEDMGVRPEEAVMVGDDIVSDVGGAQNCGLIGVLVRTGKFRPSDEVHPRVKPDAIVDDLSKAAELILQTKQETLTEGEHFSS